MVTFSVTDRETGAPLEGLLLWNEYQTIYRIPVIGGHCEVISSGDFKGAMRIFTVRVPGYVDHSYFFFQHDGRAFSIELSKFWWFEESTPPVEPERRSLLPVAAIVAAGLMMSA